MTIIKLCQNKYLFFFFIADHFALNSWVIAGLASLMGNRWVRDHKVEMLFTPETSRHYGLPLTCSLHTAYSSNAHSNLLVHTLLYKREETHGQDWLHMPTASLSAHVTNVPYKFSFNKYKFSNLFQFLATFRTCLDWMEKSWKVVPLTKKFFFFFTEKCNMEM